MLCCRYDSYVAPGSIFKEFKYCEMCSKSFVRLAGIKDPYCFKCHANWNERIDSSTLSRVSVIDSEEEVVFDPEVEKAPARSCRVKKQKLAVKKESDTRSVKERIKEAVWGMRKEI